MKFNKLCVSALIMLNWEWNIQAGKQNEKR